MYPRQKMFKTDKYTLIITLSRQKTEQNIF